MSNIWGSAHCLAVLIICDNECALLQPALPNKAPGCTSYTGDFWKALFSQVIYGVPQYQHCANSHTNRRRLRVTGRNLLKQKGNSASTQKLFWNMDSRKLWRSDIGHRHVIKSNDRNIFWDPVTVFFEGAHAGNCNDIVICKQCGRNAVSAAQIPSHIIVCAILCGSNMDMGN